MAIPKSIASIKRFGARYGRTVKHKFGAVEAMHRKKYKCPYCSKQSVKRISAGIWECKKCGAKIASRAYTVSKKKTVKEMISEAAKTGELPKEVEESAEELKEEAEEKAAV
jgi:large subunit ribosomal protein L37Ae